MKVILKIIKILPIIFLGSLLACNNNQKQKKKTEIKTNGIIMY